MSKYFKEMQKANERAQRKLADDGLYLEDMLESLKNSPPPEPPVVAETLQECQQVGVANPNSARLVLRQDNSSRAALEAYRALRTRLMQIQAKSGVRTIVISSSLPGEGKTLTTMNLGLCFAQLPQQRVLLVDADLRTCGLTSLLDRRDTLGLAKILSGEATAEQAIVATDQKNLFVLPSGTVSSPPPELFSGTRWQEFLAKCGETFKTILIDSPPILPLADFELISAACEGLVMVVRAHHGHREAVQKTAGSIDQKKLLGVVFNAAHIKHKEYGSYGYAYGYARS